MGNAQNSGFFDDPTFDTTGQPASTPPAPQPSVAPLESGPYESAGAAAAAASPANATKLDFDDWVAATWQSYPGESEEDLEAETTQQAYESYARTWATMQAMRQQPGVAEELDALLAAMAGTP